MTNNCLNPEQYKSITTEELAEWCKGTFGSFAETFLFEILTGEYPLDKAREDVLSFRKGSINEA